MGPSQRNIIFGAIGIVALGLAGYFFYSGSRGAPAISNTYRAHGVCLACKSEVDVSYPSDSMAPFKCSKCNDEAVYPLYYCMDCKFRCVPILDRSNPDEPPRLPRVPLMPVCPRCRSGNLQGFIPGLMPPEEIKGDAPLPKWP